jgi:predicted HicB family RNase H-like nuclease
MKRITLRLPDDLHLELCRIADQEDRSLNNQILQFLRQGAQDKRYERKTITSTEDTDRRAS